MADHLIEVLGPDHCPLQVFYSGPTYDCGPWDTFPDRQGWDLALLSRDDDAPKEFPAEYIPGLECWLYFGALHAIFEKDFKHEDLIRVDEADQRPYITTRCLHRYMDSALARSKSELFTAIDKTLRNLYIQLNKKKVCSSLRPDMLYIILVLAGSLTWAYDFGHKYKKTTKHRIAPHSQAAFQWADAQLLAKGWCPSEVGRFERNDILDWLSRAYALQIIRPRVRDKGHTHAKCGVGECAENYVDNTTYTTKHVQLDCECPHLGPNIEQVKSILRKGGTPLIRMSASKKTPNHLKLEVVQHSPGRRYIAISHVWSDGLGNLEGNSLPECQLNMLKTKSKEAMTCSPAYLTQTDVEGPVISTVMASYHWAGNLGQLIDDSITIWMDTLCVPRERETRNMAIKGMKKAYENAYRTLVLDSELRATTALNKSKEDILFRVLNCSGWMRRLWTLQEGLAAAKSLYVLFADAILNIPELADKMWRKSENGRYKLISIAIPEYSYGLWFGWFRMIVYTNPTWLDRIFDAGFYIGRMGGKTGKCELIAYSWANVAARATSRDEDRPIILAGIVNVDPGPLLQIRGNTEERMKAFYGLFKRFPQGIVFLPGPRFEEEGWRWALKVCRLQEGAISGNVIDDTPALRRSEGLVVKYPSITVELEKGLQPLEMKITTGFLLAITHDSHENNQEAYVPRQPLKTIYIHQDKRALGNGIHLPELPTPAIGILFADPSEKVQSLLAGEEGRSGRLRCVILSMYRTEEKISFGRFLMHGLVSRQADVEEDWGMSISQISGTRLPKISTSSLVQRSWCVG